MRDLQEWGSLVSSLTARRLLTVAVAAVVVAVDQVTKTWAEHQQAQHLVGSLWLFPTLNRGAAFSLGRGVTPIIEAVVVLLIAGLVIFSRRASRGASIPVSVCLGLLVGGAVGNLVDRVIRDNGGAVIDFIDAARIGHHDWWPVFNVADASIVVGAIVLALAYARGKGARPAQPPATETPGPERPGGGAGKSGTGGPERPGGGARKSGTGGPERPGGGAGLGAGPGGSAESGAPGPPAP